MKSSRSKMVQTCLEKPLCRWSLDVASSLDPEHLLAVVGFQQEQVRLVLPDSAQTVVQSQQLGTGHALQQAFRALEKSFSGAVMVLYGDTPLIRAETLRQLLDSLQGNEMAMLTSFVQNPRGYGRIIRDNSGLLCGVVEEKEATLEQRAIAEINSGIYVFRTDFLLKHLFKLTNNNYQQEYYLTDLVACAAGSVATVLVDEAETLGVNDYTQLAYAESVLRQRINTHWMRQGVQMVDPVSTYIGPDVTIEPDTFIEPGVQISGKTRIETGARIKAYSVIEESEIGAGTQVGPFAHLRSGSRLGEKCKIGNFVETKKASFKKGSKVNHLAYIGDAEVGEFCNIGAGTITCNYDGTRKHSIQVEDGVFVGSNSTLIAPVKLGKGSYVGAGSVVTQDVPAQALALGRARQVNKEGRMKKNN